ncbi:copper amine oxidase N-terminal domain-containing protein [Clostridiaceae bacterium 35-E11]
MKVLNAFLKKYKQMITGIIIGSMVSAGGAVFAESPSVVFARIMNAIQFEFNGEIKEISKEYTVLNYKDRTYVPARFIAENLGAEVKWDEKTNTISMVTKQEKERNEKEDEKETEIPKIDYGKLPMKQRINDIWVEITGITIKEEDKVAWVYLEVENEAGAPIMVDQRRTRIIANEKTYKQEDTHDAHPYDKRWFNNVKEDEKVTGFIKMPIWERGEEWEDITLILKIIQNDGSQKETEVEFNIAL